MRRTARLQQAIHAVTARIGHGAESAAGAFGGRLRCGGDGLKKRDSLISGSSSILSMRIFWLLAEAPESIQR